MTASVNNQFTSESQRRVGPFLLASWMEIDPSFLSDRPFVGGKADGLFRLPKEWVPEFIVLTSAFYERWIEKGDALQTFASLPPDQYGLLTEFLRRTARTGGPSIIVRSNSPEEHSVDSRGRHQSELANPELEELSIVIDKVLAAAGPDSMNAIIQRFIQPAWPGHMSNERRISPKRSTWLIEAFPPLPGLTKDGMIQARRTGHRGPLMAGTQQQLLQSLRLAAGMLAAMHPGYFHCEWAWDGRRLWLLQADRAENAKEHLSSNKYIDVLDAIRPKTRGRTRKLLHFTDVEPERWKKLERPFVFKQLGWPTADVYVLTGEDWDKSRISEHAELRLDLRELCEQLVVVRCDLSAEVAGEDLLLRTSEPTSDINRVLDFMAQSSDYFCAQGIPKKDWAFLLAALVPARASAMVHAHPEGQVIRIDATWGFPDGLLFFPHDTYFYYPAGNRPEVKLRFKGMCLLAQDGAWNHSDVGPPHDWSRVLSEAEIRTLAQWGLELARKCDTDVQLMALARIGGRRGPDACLPWHFTTLKIPPYGESRPSLLTFRDIEIIQNLGDIEKYPATAPDPHVRGYLIRPNASLIRDASFIRRAAQLAAQHKVPILFEGSLLGHAYYLMAREGAVVIPIRPENPESSVTKYDKLVRDNIPAVIERAGGIARIHMLPRDEAIVLLARKLIEEAYEVWDSNAQSLPGELADVLEVVESLRDQARIEPDRLRAIQDRKRAVRGGFGQLIYLRETSARPLESSDLQQGVMPLFLDDHSQSGPQPTKASQPSYLELHKVDASNAMIQFSISRLPPVEKGQRLTIVHNASRGVEVVCQYAQDELTFVVIQEDKMEPVSEQLDLFAEDAPLLELDQLGLFQEDINDG